jgi:hypothetical protein
VACLLSLVVLVAAMLAASGANASARHRSRCSPYGTHTIALDKSVRVYFVPDYMQGVATKSRGIYACLLHRGTTLALALPAHRKHPGHKLDHITLAGAIVAFVDFQFYIDAGCEVIEVIDVARQRMVLSVPSIGCRGKALEGAQATDLVVNERGSVAWITQRWMRLTRGPAATVGFEVHSETTSGSTTLLDSGASIVPGSLRLAPGGEVSWLDAGRTLYALLP